VVLDRDAADIDATEALRIYETVAAPHIAGAAPARAAV
jgi:hypothetical protein